jgi:hypothetical protein
MRNVKVTVVYRTADNKATFTSTKTLPLIELQPYLERQKKLRAYVTHREQFEKETDLKSLVEHLPAPLRSHI